MEFLLGLFFALSLALNGYLYITLKQTKSTQYKKNIATLDSFIVDLGRGASFLQVQRVNPDDVMVRSPRGRL